MAHGPARHECSPVASRGVLAISVAILTACGPLQPVGDLPVTASRVTAPPASGGGTATPGRIGSLRLTIDWGGRVLQALPVEAMFLDIDVTTSRGVQILQQRFVRPEAGGHQGLTLPGLPAGTVQVTVQARDRHEKVLRTGHTEVQIRPNAVNGARLSLRDALEPTLFSLAPDRGEPGTTVLVSGSALGTAGDPIEARVGDLAAHVSRLDDAHVRVTIPEHATTSAIVLTLGARTVRSPVAFTTIRSWEVTPRTAEVFEPHGVQDVMAIARDWAGNPVPSQVTWSLRALSGPTGRLVRADGATASVQVGEGAAELELRVSTRAEAPVVRITTHELSPSDVAGQLTALAVPAAPAANSNDARRIALGKALFLDERLGRTGAMGCVTCHRPDRGWADARTRSAGNDGLGLDRHTPTVLNAGLIPGPMFWDGRAPDLESQVLAVFASGREFDRPASDVPALLTNLGYESRFTDAFGPGHADLAHVSQAIAAFERTLVTGDSPFDRWMRGDSRALSPAQLRGLGIFMTTGKCISCHQGATFSDGKFHHINVLEDDQSVGAGRAGVTGNPGDHGRFRTPPLRQVAETAPYFHHGRTRTLGEAILHYEGNFRPVPGIDPVLVEPVRLGAEGRADLEQFMHALSGATGSFQP